jgi:Protein of unknown function (DUF2917)
MTSTVNAGAIAPFQPVQPARKAGVSRPAADCRRPLALCAGDLLRIVDGQGTRVRAKSGVLWITEERVSNDVVLQAGESHRIASRGTTIVEAHRAARIVIEMPVGVPRPAAIELAFPGGLSRRFHLTGSAPRAAFERLQLALARTFTRVSWPAPEEAFVGERRRRVRSHARDDANDYTPEAVRDRLLRAYPYPYY